MITEIDVGKRSNECPLCGLFSKIRAKQRQKFKEMDVDKYTFVCSNCSSLWFAVGILDTNRVIVRKFFSTDDLYDYRELFPDEEWQFSVFGGSRYV